MRETNKAYRLLQNDPLWQQVPRGAWLDVGCGDDCLPGATGWDKADGDAHTLPGVPLESQDLVFSSHCLEHLEYPGKALLRWLEVLKPNGYLWVIVPDFELYEHGEWPSLFNPDHKQRFMPWHTGNDYSGVIYLEDLARDLPAKLKRIQYRDSGYDETRLKELTDQTLGEAEASCELVMQKLPVDSRGT